VGVASRTQVSAQTIRRFLGSGIMAARVDLHTSLLR
jgi:hypothetical protein